MKPDYFVPAVVTPDVRYLTSADGTAVYAEAVGSPSNPHVVFLHGFSLSTVAFDCIFYDQRYVAQFYLVRYDMRGHGRSGKPRDTEAYASKRLAQDFAAVAEAYDLKRPIFAGWSLGGTVIADITAHLPSYTLSGAVYLGALPYTTGMTQRVVTASVLEKVATFHHNDDVGRFVATKMPFIASCFARPDQVTHELKCLWAGATLASTPVDLELAFNRPQDPAGLLKVARDGTLPLLVLHGDLDVIVDCKSLVREVKAIPWRDVEVVILEGVGHAPFYESTESVMKHIGRFANRVQRKKYGAKL